MAFSPQLVARISQELLDELTKGGTRDFRQTRLNQMEREVYEIADRVSARVLRGILEDQAKQAQAESCPCCQGSLEERPPDDRPLQLQRCEVQWERPVKRCPKCRRDFFPSSRDDGLHRRSDV